MKKLFGLLPLMPALLVAAAAFIGLAVNQPILEEVVWPSKPDLSSYAQAEKQTEASDLTDYAVSSDISKAAGSLSSNDKKKTAVSSDSVEAKSDQKQNQKSQTLTVKNYKAQTLKDGTYMGSAQGFGGSIRVQVTVSKGKISGIQVLDHSGETPAFYQKAAAIISTIISKQTPNVDTVTGATYSSNGIREAVKAALEKAGMTSSSEDTKKTSDSETSGKGKSNSSKTDTDQSEKTNQTDKSKKGKSSKEDKATEETAREEILKNGTYTASAQVAADENGDFTDYTLTAEVTFKDDALAGIDNLVLKPSNSVNKNYSKRAVTGIVTGIVASGSPENAEKVDVVTGATCSSKAVKEIYQDAWQQAKEALETERAAENAVSGDSVSGNAVSGDTVSGNAVSDHTISGSTVSENAVSGDAGSGDAGSGDSVSGDSVSGDTLSGAVLYEGGLYDCRTFMDSLCGKEEKKFLRELYLAGSVLRHGGRS